MQFSKQYDPVSDENILTIRYTTLEYAEASRPTALPSQLTYVATLINMVEKYLKHLNKDEENE